MLDKASINNRPKFKSVIGAGMGKGAQIIRARKSASVGVRINSVGEEGDGRIGSLVNNFTPSAIGCRRPYGPTMFGPFRSCMYPKIFRSSRVRKATAIKIGMMNSRGFIRCNKRGVIIKEMI